MNKSCWVHLIYVAKFPPFYSAIFHHAGHGWKTRLTRDRKTENVIAQIAMLSKVYIRQTLRQTGPTFLLACVYLGYVKRFRLHLRVDFLPWINKEISSTGFVPCVLFRRYFSELKFNECYFNKQQNCRTGKLSSTSITILQYFHDIVRHVRNTINEQRRKLSGGVGEKKIYIFSPFSFGIYFVENPESPSN